MSGGPWRVGELARPTGLTVRTLQVGAQASSDIGP